MYKIYYDKKRNFTIVDVSGIKPIEKIEKEFGKTDYQKLEIDPETEDYIIENECLKKVKKNA